jgi:hypothetical protein
MNQLQPLFKSKGNGNLKKFKQHFINVFEKTKTYLNQSKSLNNVKNF